jgi:hypothetical protein
LDWKTARLNLAQSHVQRAAEWVRTQCKGGKFDNLYRITNCQPARHRYLDVEGQRLPAKAFGYLVLMEAGWDRNDDYRPTVNEVAAPLYKFGVIETA